MHLLLGSLCKKPPLCLHLSAQIALCGSVFSSSFFVLQLDSSLGAYRLYGTYATYIADKRLYVQTPLCFVCCKSPASLSRFSHRALAVHLLSPCLPIYLPTYLVLSIHLPHLRISLCPPEYVSRCVCLSVCTPVSFCGGPERPLSCSGASSATAIPVYVPHL